VDIHPDKTRFATGGMGKVLFLLFSTFLSTFLSLFFENLEIEEN